MSKYEILCDEFYWIFSDILCIIIQTIKIPEEMEERMMRKFLYSTKNISCGDNIPEAVSVEYYVVEYESENEGINITTYGIEVVKKQKIDGITYSEIKTIADICSSERMILAMVKAISNNTVTPITLEEVVEDMLKDEKYSFVGNDIEKLA